MMKMDNFILVCLLLCFSRDAVSEDLPQYALETGLRKQLMTNYDAPAEPRQKPTEGVNVTLSLMLGSIEHFDEVAEVLTTSVWIGMKWRDDRLKWIESDFPGVKKLTIPIKSIWRPDISLSNSAGEIYESPSKVPAVVSSDGSVLFMEHNVLRTTCTVDFEYYPIDMQACEIKFASWPHDENKLNLNPESEDGDRSLYHHSRDWKLIECPIRKKTIMYPCCPESFTDITMVVKMKRKTGLILHLYIGPAVCFGLMVPVVFLLPPNSNQKLILGGSLLISQVLTMNTLTNSLPIRYSQGPRIAYYLLANTVLLSLSLTVSAIIINMWNRSLKGGRGVPVIVKRVCLGLLGRLCCVRPEDILDTSSGQHERSDSDGDGSTVHYSRLSPPSEWLHLAIVLDRMFLVLFLVCSLIIMAALVPFSGPHPY